MKIITLESDKIFSDSPDTGTPACICSRCGKMIPGDEAALRLYSHKLPLLAKELRKAYPIGPIEYIMSEYRYCRVCWEKPVGMAYLSQLLGYDVHILSGTLGEHLAPIVLDLMMKIEKDLGEIGRERDEYLWLKDIYFWAMEYPLITQSWKKTTQND